jgi:EpsI family protein
VSTQTLRLGDAGNPSSGFSRSDVAHAAAAVVCALALVWLIAPTLATLNESWLGLAYSHGYLVLLIVAWLVAGELKRAALPPARASGWGVAALALCVLAMLVAYAAEVLILAQCLLPLLALATVWALAGASFVRRLWQPVFYLYFAIPFWDFATTSLRQLTTRIVGVAVHAVGIPAFIEANRISIPSGSIEVAEGCSGLHFLIVGLALAGLYGLAYLPRWRERIVLATAAAGLSLFANWLRVFLLVVIGHVSQMQNYLIVESHYYFGWALFLVVIAPIALLGRWLEARTPESRDGGLPPANAPVGRAPSRFGAAAVAAAVALGGAWLGHWVRAAEAAGPAALPIELPPLAGWQQSGSWSDARRPHYVGAGAEAAGWYRQGASQIGVYVANYPSQHQGREAVFFANRAWGQAGAPRARQVVELTAGNGVTYPFAELRIVEPDRPDRLVWRGVRVAGRATASDLVAKVLQAAGALLGRTDAQVVVLTVVCEASCSESRATLSGFAAQAVTDLYGAAEQSTAHGGASPRNDQ